MNSSIRQSSMKHECSRTTYWLRLLCGGSLATSKRCIREKRGCSSQYIFGFRSARFPAIKVYPLLSALTRSTGPSWCFLISDKTDYQRSGAFSAGSRGRSAGQPIGGARSAHKLTSQLDHSVRADQSLSAAGTKNRQVSSRIAPQVLACAAPSRSAASQASDVGLQMCEITARAALVMLMSVCLLYTSDAADDLL